MPSQDIATLFKSMAAQGFTCMLAIHPWKAPRAGTLFVEIVSPKPKYLRKTLQLPMIPDNLEDVVNALASEAMVKHYAG